MKSWDYFKILKLILGERAFLREEKREGQLWSGKGLEENSRFIMMIAEILYLNF